ncbi:MAG: hypothetical protein ACLFST_04915 [Spirochaetia bacterium]
MNRIFLIGIMIIFMPGIMPDAEENSEELLLTLPVIIDLSKGDSAAGFVEVLGNSIHQKLKSLGFQVSPEPVFLAIPDFDDLRIESFIRGNLSEASEAGLLALCFVHSRESSVMIQLILYDPVQKNILGGIVRRSRIGLSLYNDLEDVVESAEPMLKQYLEDRYFFKPRTDVVEQIDVTGSQENVQVFLAGQEMGEISGGTLFIPYTPFNLGSNVKMKLTKEGHHSGEYTVSLDNRVSRIELPRLAPLTGAGFRFFWTYGSAYGAGAGLRVYMIPDESFVDLDHHVSFYPPGNNRSSLVTVYNFQLTAGIYLFFPHNSPFRFNLSTGAGVSVSSIMGYGGQDFNDFYLSLINPCIEADFGSFLLFLRPEFRYALGAGNRLMHRGWIMIDRYGIPPITAGGMITW